MQNKKKEASKIKQRNRDITMKREKENSGTMW
jgi:hypothetical protein